MRQWLYKQGEEARIFEDKQIDEALKSGWVDTPAKFAENTIIDLEDLSDKELRGLAKKAKVKSYHLLGREKLIASLKD